MEIKRDGQSDQNPEQDDLMRLKRYLEAPEEKNKPFLKEDEYIPGVVMIMNDLYPKSPEIHAQLLKYLDEQGYDVKDCTVPEPGHEKYFDRPSPEIQKREGWYTGFASLKDNVLQNVAKCDACGGYVSKRGVLEDGHTCEKCGEVMFDELPKGSQAKFSYFFEPENEIRGIAFTEDGDAKEESIHPSLLAGGSLVVESYDPKTKEVYCYGELSEVTKEGIDFGSSAENTYRRLASDNHIDRIVIRREDVEEIWGSKRNFREVKLFRGQEYDDFMGKLPVPETFTIYQPWHWMPLQSSPTMHEKIIHAAGMVSSKDYYYQDGRAAFYDIHLARMRTFVKNFTNIDLARWDYMIRNAKKSGPGMIDAIAYFCDENPIIKDEPNIGNFLVGLADSIEGKPKTKDQIRAEIKYLRSEGFNGSVDDLIEYMRELGIIPDRAETDQASQEESWIQDIWDSLDLNE